MWSASLASASDWKGLTPNQGGGMVYYDQQSIKRTGNGLVKVWLKTAPDPNKNSSGSAGTTIVENLTLFEFDCKTDMIRLVDSVATFTDGTKYRPKKDNDFSKWMDIIPDSGMEQVGKLVCIKPATNPIH